MAISDTRLALELMGGRIAAMFEGYLIDDPLLRPRYVQLLAHERSAAAIEIRQRELLQEFISRPTAANPLARGMVDEVADLAWVTLITALVDRERCQLTNLGRFDIREDRGRMVVDFRPAEFMITFGESAELPVSDNKVEQLAILLCHKAFQQRALANYPDRELPLEVSATRLLGEIVNDLSEEFAAYSPPNTALDIDFDPAYLHARALAYATYHSYVLTLARLLRMGPVAIELVGTFQAAGTISFSPSSTFFGLLSANRLTTA